MCSWLLEKQNSGNFEIWNHGLMHLPGEMDERDLGEYVAGCVPYVSAAFLTLSLVLFCSNLHRCMFLTALTH
jgi:hypothetical protein